MVTHMVTKRLAIWLANGYPTVTKRLAVWLADGYLGEIRPRFRNPRTAGFLDTVQGFPLNLFYFGCSFGVFGL